jgi:hypothetical protein
MVCIHMTINTVIVSILFGALIPISYSAESAAIFEDSFETGDYSSTNVDGFKWTDNAWTSIVSSSEEVAGVNGVPRTKPNAASFPGLDWTPHTGEYSLRFRYAAGEFMSEQRFDFGVAYPDIWISFWLRVPTNFAFGPVGNPNKLFALWMDGYSQAGVGSTVWLSMWRSGTSDATLGFTYSLGDFTASTQFQQYKPFITTRDAGRWMEVVLHVKAETTPGSSDGVIQTFRRWEGESHFTTIHDTAEAPLKIPESGPNGFKSGYILGWANAAFEENTEWLVDDFKLSEEPLVIGPKPISGLSIQ